MSEAESGIPLYPFFFRIGWLVALAIIACDPDSWLLVFLKTVGIPKKRDEAFRLFPSRLVSLASGQNPL